MHTLGSDARRDPAGTPFPTSAGSYVLLIRLRRRLRVAPRSQLIEPGWYAYCGSARGPGGLRARVARHLRSAKSSHWHIDRLARAGVIRRAYLYDRLTECELLGQLRCLAAASASAPGFGSSDCARCPSHLLGIGTDCAPADAALQRLGPIYVYTRAAS